LNYFSIFLYLIFDLKPFEWKFIDALFTIRNYYDVRLYFSASSHPFIIHFCACHLIKILIQNQRPTSSNFMTIAESSALKVINAFSNSAKAISIFC
jgi:hypothetical protein